ncbi:MAG: DUF3892 domain-containing protein [Oscillospiraceae bacterium]|nr:DUF3892 domain-containing protein [Oscillospiraceae bacterium]
MKNLKVSRQSKTDLNIEFVNANSNRRIPLEQVITQIKNDNPTYGNYHVSRTANGTEYVRSNPDSKVCNNIEP